MPDPAGHVPRQAPDHSHDHGHDHDHDHAHRHGDRGGHRHGHGHAHAPASFGAAFAIGAALNIALVLAQLVYGLAAHSMALLADAVHNLGDVLGLLLAWGAVWLGGRVPSSRRTYGWGRSSILAALANSAVLLVSVGAIAVAAIQRLLEPAPIAGGTVMIVAGAGIVINGLTAWLFSAGGTGGASTDLNIRATFLHMAADAAVSAGVVLSAALIGLTGWLWLDPLASLAIVAVITAGTWSVLRQSANLAMDGVPEAIAHGEVQAYLASLPGVLEVHDLHIWALSTTQTALTAHLVRRDPGHDQSLLAEAARHLDQHFHINHATLQTESPELAATCRLRPAELV